ncbi:MAG: Hpt domain-containing protein [Magnetococcales bacterium]|nr:Hpt domain-containing protein [Magnetococcales bacterium]NGZ26527.1 Hpt domain-containing protein [Magnetococcales bacterium]
MTTPLDVKSIQSLQKELGEDFALVLGVYLEKIPSRVQAIAHALQEEDKTKLGQAAHALKGSSRQFGANHLADLCHELETRCKGDTPLADGHHLMQTIEQEAKAVEKAMNQLIQPD